MWNLENRLEYRDAVGDLLNTSTVQSLRGVRQHSASINCYDHSLFVSYLSFRICKRLGWDAKAAARGGLLHDLFLYDQHDKRSYQHLTCHPMIALQNARRLFKINRKEADMIVKHMWPLTYRLPKYKESFVVCMVDKVCALSEMLHLYHVAHVSENMELVYQPQ